MLYKQATKGDATGERPGAFDFVARAKFDAWSEVAGVSADEAMQQYIDLVASLRHYSHPAAAFEADNE